MKKLVFALLITLLTSGVGFASKNPKLLKEIKRKVTLDLNQFKFKQDQQEFVVVKFTVTDNKINIINIEGSMDELTKIMMDELEKMVIHTDIKDATTYQYKFKFEKE